MSTLLTGPRDRSFERAFAAVERLHRPAPAPTPAEEARAQLVLAQSCMADVRELRQRPEPFAHMQPIKRLREALIRAGLERAASHRRAAQRVMERA